MGTNSKIEWTDHTANFWWGCLKVSPGCEHCYADTMAHRWGKDIWGPAKTTDREFKKGVWANVRKWEKEAKESGVRHKVFCMSMGDFFEDHPQVTEIRDKALDLISRCRHLDWQILTKRPENVISMIERSQSHSFSDADMWFYANPHVWIGTSVENQEQYNIRSKHLRNIPAAVTFYSMEPLLGSVTMDDNDPVSWVIVGGESGPNARPMHPDWVRDIRDQCQEAGVAFFFKQWGAWLPEWQFESFVGKARADKVKMHVGQDIEFYRVGKKASGRHLDGRTWDEFPYMKGESGR